MTSSSLAATLLVVLPNWLGDVIMAGDLLGSLAAWRDREGRSLALHVSIRRRWQPLVAGDRRLAGVHVYERTGRHAGWSGAPRLAREWRGLRVDAAVIAPPSWRTAAVATLAGIPRRIGAAGDGRSPLLTHAVRWTRPRGRVHHADELQSLAAAALADLGLAIATPPAAGTLWPALAQVRPMALPAGPPLWILAPGATYGPAKIWPLAHQADWLRESVRGRDRRVVVIGDQASGEQARALREVTAGLGWSSAPSGDPGVVDLTGRTTLPELIAWLRAAEAFVGNDSGVMHLAAALGVATVGVFGSSSVAWTAPRGSRAVAVAAEGFSCQPCFRRECNQPRFCLETVTAAQVLDVLDELLARPSGKEPHEPLA